MPPECWDLAPGGEITGRFSSVPPLSYHPPTRLVLYARIAKQKRRYVEDITNRGGYLMSWGTKTGGSR